MPVSVDSAMRMIARLARKSSRTKPWLLSIRASGGPEIVVNSYALFINRRSVPRVWKRTLPIIAGLVPGVVVGSFLLSTVNPGVIKVVTYAVLLPLILLQAGGFRRYIHAERRVGAPLGIGIGILYSVTTISGPPWMICVTETTARATRATAAAQMTSTASLKGILGKRFTSDSLRAPCEDRARRFPA